MARKRRTRRYSPRRGRRTYSRARGGGGKYKPVIDGLLAGVAATLVKRFLPNTPFADDAALIGVGIFRKNPTLTTIGAMGLGSDLIAGFGGGMPGGGGGYIG